MAFTKEHLSELEFEIEQVPIIAQRIQDVVLSYPYQSDTAREHAFQGYLRRINTLVRCIQTVFRKLPPRRRKPPSADNLKDAEICLQAFVLNVSGCLDNMAWIWVKETGLTKPSGAPVSRRDIGLRKTHSTVRNSLSADFGAYLDEIDGWLAANEDYRDSLAHRIPLYIPPFSVLIEKISDHRKAELAINVAALRGDDDEEKKLTSVRDRLRFFQPVMTHSYGESARPMIFHAQMIADLKTLWELSKRLYADLEAHSGRGVSI